MKSLWAPSGWRELVLETGRSLMAIAKTNRAILTRYRAELDELRAARLASVETERELRGEIDALYGIALNADLRALNIERAHVKLGDTVIALGDQLRRADESAKVRLDALEATIRSLEAALAADRGRD